MLIFPWHPSLSEFALIWWDTDWFLGQEHRQEPVYVHTKLEGIQRNQSIVTPNEPFSCTKTASGLWIAGSNLIYRSNLKHPQQEFMFKFKGFKFILID